MLQKRASAQIALNGTRPDGSCGSCDWILSISFLPLQDADEERYGPNLEVIKPAIALPGPHFRASGGSTKQNPRTQTSDRAKTGTFTFEGAICSAVFFEKRPVVVQQLKPPQPIHYAPKYTPGEE